MRLPVAPPLAPMLSTAANMLPTGDGWQFEPKWDGFRTLVFRDGDEILLQSRDEKPMNRYFPELVGPLAAASARALRGRWRDRDRRGRWARLRGAAPAHPSGGVPGEAARGTVAGLVRRLGPARARRRGLAQRAARGAARTTRAGAGGRRPPLHLSPATRDRALAEDWFRRFEGAGLDGVMAKRLDAAYRAGERTMIKVKHERTADCVVAGFRWHKNGPGTMVGSLLLGLYDDAARAAPRRRRGGVHERGAQAARRRAGAAPAERARWASLARLGGGAGGGQRAGAAAAGRDQPVESRQGSELGAAPARARLRGRLRPHAGDPVSGTRRSSCAGARTSARRTADTISSRSRPPTSSDGSSARAIRVASVPSRARDRSRGRAAPRPAARSLARGAG